MSRVEQNELKERTRKAFYHSYNSYMTYAYPQVRCPVQSSPFCQEVMTYMSHPYPHL